jgi:hypothetical protein
MKATKYEDEDILDGNYCLFAHYLAHVSSLESKVVGHCLTVIDSFLDVFEC